MQFVFIIIAFVIGGLVALWILWHLLVLGFSLFGLTKLVRFLEKRKQTALLNMEQFHNRLCVVVEDLMIRFDDLDQESNYVPAIVDKKWSAEIGSSCSELLSISERLKVVAALIEEKDVRQSRETILLAVRDTVRIQRRYKDMKSRLDRASAEPATEHAPSRQSEPAPEESSATQSIKLIEMQDDSMPDGSTISRGEFEKGRIERSPHPEKDR